MFHFKSFVFLIIAFLVAIKFYAQNDNKSFELYTNHNGLSNSHVNCISQDAKGFMWFGTDYGLNKFDGFSFTTYKNNPYDKKSLPSDEVSALHLDKDGFLWVGTYNGLAKYDHRTGHFQNFFINEDSIHYYKPVRALTGDNSGKIWVGTSGNGVMVIDAKTGVYLKDLNRVLASKIGKEHVYSLLIDKQNNLWIGTEGNGIKVFNIDSQTVKHYQVGNTVLRDNWILTLFEDAENNIWIGTRGGGLSLFNTRENKFTDNLKIEKIVHEVYSFAYNTDSTLWIGTNNGGLITYDFRNKKFSKHATYEAENNFKGKRIRVLFPDKDGNIWLGIHQLGIGLMKNYNYPFQQSRIKLPEEVTINKESILGILLDSQQNLWVGTDGNGLIKYNILSGNYKRYLPERTKNSIPSNVIRTIYEDSNGNIWIGTYKGGLSKYNKNTDNFSNFLNKKDDLSSLGYSDVIDIAEDNKKRLWVATNGGGLNLMNEDGISFTRFTTNSLTQRSLICHDWLTCLFKDSKGFLWVGSFWGLSKFDTEQYLFKNYYNDLNDQKSLSSNIVFAINEDKSGNIWVGTKRGLNRLNPETNDFTYFDTDDGLPNEVINSIMVDGKNNLWLGTNNGLAKFNVESHEVLNYYFQDGLASNEFIHNSAYKTNNGQLLFGSVYGFNAFSPDSIKDENYFPETLITDFKIFNQSVPIGELDDGRTILNQSIAETKNIELEYSDNSFSFDFVALDYTHPEQVIYSCKMIGFEENWNYLDFNRRFITYTNLDPGTYTFVVKASNKMEKWGDNETKITIRIHPPAWLTKWAYFIYIIVIVGSALFLWKLNFDRIRAKNQVKIERIKKAQEDKLNQSKLEFFTNISHEFRTPLTLIIGPIETLIENEKLNDAVKRSLHMMSRNARRLLRLVNQLLDLRKVEKGKLKLEAQQTDIIKFVYEVYESFEQLAKSKRINYQLKKNNEKLEVYFDHDKLDKILFNLLSNAFKFTPQEGKIVIKISTNPNKSNDFKNGYVQIQIKDNGRGMSVEHVERIFERFYQSPASEGSIQKGTGIGLSLTKSLVNLHHGQITVESAKGEGSVFRVKLPLGSSHLLTDEIIETRINEHVDANAQPVVLEGYENVSFGSNSGKIADNSAPLILLVEDNEDVRNYIKNGLIDKYLIEEAENGKEGLKKAHNLMPDLIISDVMMPEMDGITFCKKIKTELVSCHIPVILLTAKSSIEHRIEGLETGADSYIPKPFNPKHLLIRVEKLIELRQRLKEKFKTESDFEPIQMAVTSADEKFMKKTVEIIKEKIADSDLGVESLSEKVGMDRSHLYRKLKSLVGQTPSEFIRTIRLKQAAYLLANEDIPVSEVSYLVGFNSPSYFASCFNKQYKESPTQYKETNFRKE